MKTQTQPQKKTKGIILIASYNPNFYKMAINCAESILDYYPDAKITLFTEEKYIDDRVDIFDNVIHCDDHYRAKLWGMANSPYDITFYMDVDMEVVHEDISKVFDELGDNELVFTTLQEETDYAFKARHFPGGEFALNGGVCLYDNTVPLVKEFMKDWDELYKKQRAHEWWPLNENNEFDFINYPKSLRVWDQFTLWWLTNKEDKYKNIKLGEFQDFARWNWYTKYLKKHNKDEIVIVHHSSPTFNKWKDNI